MLDLIQEMTVPEARREMADRIAVKLGAAHLFFFILDPELKIYLPAIGFPQSLPGGARWRALAVQAEEEGRAEGKLVWKDQNWNAFAQRVEEGAVVVVLTTSHAPRLETFVRHALLLTSLFRQEFATRCAQVQAQQARRSANQAEALAQGLDQARRRLQTTLRELRRATLAAEEASRAKSQFLANMSHEIRTPLHGVMGTIDLLAQSPLNEQQLRDVEVARACGRSLLSIIEDVLDFSKIEARKLELEELSFDLEDLLHSVGSVHAKIAQDKNLEFSSELDCPSPCPVTGDPHRLAQVLHNLLSNAVKFTEAGSVTFHVVVREVEKGWDCTFEVIDTGVGVAEKTIAVLFAPFQQADASTTRRFGGSGLGLTISRELVTLMGGTIGVTSTEDVGSTFTVRLPLRRGELVEESGYSGPVHEGTLRVLLAEDNPINRGVVTRMLEIRGHTVLEASDGVEALEVWDSEPVDLVLMDMHMPGMDGVEATREIRRRERQYGRPAVMLIALTAATSVEDRNVCLQAGADAHLAKPVSVRDFEKLLGRAQKRMSEVSPGGQP